MKELLPLLPYLRKYAVLIVAGLTLVIIANAFALVPPYLIKRAVDALGSPAASEGMLLRYAALIVGAAILGGLARYGMRELLNGVSRRVELDLRNDVFDHLLGLDAAYYGSTQTGEIMSRATNDIAAVRMVAGPAYMYLVNTVVISAFAVALMIWISPGLTLVAMVPMLALPPVTLGFGTLIHRRFEAIQKSFGTMSSVVQENLAGVRIVKAYSQEERQARRFRELSDEYLRRNVSLAHVSGLFHPLLGLLSGLALAGVLLLGGRSVAGGAITIGDFIAFMLYLGMLAWPMIALGWVVSLFQRGAASMRRINEILTAEASVKEPLNPVRPMTILGRVEFRNVSFRYPGTNREILRDVSFSIPPGGQLAIVGHTGSGKSTIASLLARLYDPSGGEVLIDGHPLRDVALADLRSSIGVVPQDTFLFSDTIEQNLTIGLDGADPAENRARLTEASRIARLEETIDDLPSGYETLLGERGVNLSGGQKQRAALARAIARGPRILILDDALSAVDTHTEAEILSGLASVMRTRTSIIISHRASAVRDADLILVMDAGRVVERGTHAELIEKGGAYASLVRRQLLAEEVGELGILAAPGGDL